MFTGIIEGPCRVVAREELEGGCRLHVDLGEFSTGARIGDSVALNGCCLTVETLDRTVARFHLTRETLSLTNLGEVRQGGIVNVERALRADSRLDGHMVSGHVEGTGVVRDIAVEPSQTLMEFAIPRPLLRYVILKGSITLDGISLTVAKLLDDGIVVALIPKTLERTNLEGRRVGDRINVETDMIAKWIERLVLPYRTPDAKDRS